MLLNSREPIALHWPVIELAPVPGRPMLPVISARLMIACAVRDAFVALVDAHRPPERDALAVVDRARRTRRSPRRVRAGRLGHALERERLRRMRANSSKPLGVRVDELAVDPAALRSADRARP